MSCSQRHTKRAIMFAARDYHLRDVFVFAVRSAPISTFILLLIMLIRAIQPMITILATSSFVDTALAIVAGENKRETIWLPLLLIAGLILYTYVSKSIESVTTSRVKLRLEENIRIAMIKKRARLQISCVENSDSWNLIERVCRKGPDRFFECMSDTIQLISVLIVMASLLITVLTQAWWVALIIGAGCIPLIILSAKGGKTQYKGRQNASAAERAADSLHEVLVSRESADERALFGYYEKVHQQWYDKIRYATELIFKEMIHWSIRSRGLGIVIMAACTGIAVLLAIPLVKGSITVGMYVGIVTTYFNQVNSIILGLTKYFERLTYNREYMREVSQFAALPEQEGAEDQRKTPERHFSTIEFRNIHFAYPGTDKVILDQFNLVLHTDLHYALVGRNGAGKTTIIKLLTGLYDTYEGTILLDGKDIRSFTPAERKGMFSVLYQDYARYEVTLRENITMAAYGREISDDCINKAISLSGVEEWVDTLSQGLNTPLGKLSEASQDISDGQWQQVAIARSIVTDAPVTILDEPTAALDPLTESRLYNLFGRINKDKSTIIVTHRLGSALLADIIIVIDEGHVVEMGNHKELLAQGGLYAKMFESQRSWYE